MGVRDIVAMVRFEETIGNDKAAALPNGFPIGPRGKYVLAPGIQGIVFFIEPVDIVKSETRHKAPHGREDFLGVVLRDYEQVGMLETRLVIIGFIEKVYPLGGVKARLYLLFRFSQ